MRQRTCAVLVMFVLVSPLLLLAGCAGQEGGNLPDDPELIQRQIRDLDSDIANTEEMLKGSKAQLQIEDSQVLRDYIRGLEMKMYELRSQRAALVERFHELTSQESR